MKLRLDNSGNVRNFIFGVEDSLVSTVGLISGIAAVGVPAKTVILTGVILIFVEAFSMSIGSLLSDNSAKEFEHRKSVSLSASTVSSVVMFFSYFLSGFIILAPYMLFDRVSAMPLSIALALLSLFLLGLVSGKLTGTPVFKKGIVMSVIGGLAVFVGMIVGMFLDKF